MTIRSIIRIIFQIIYPSVFLAVPVLEKSLWSKSSSSDGKFLYQPSIYLQQETDPTSALFPVLYQVVNNAGRYFIVKVYRKS